jgi:hypothetical protein
MNFSNESLFNIESESPSAKINSKKRVKRMSNKENFSFNSADTTNDFLILRRQINDIQDEDSENSKTDDEISEELTYECSFPSNAKKSVMFSCLSGINRNHLEIFSCVEPYDFYSLFVSDEIFNIIAVQTNLFASQKLSNQQSYRLDQWFDTDPNEIRRFFGLIIWMGIVRIPSIKSYWSKNEGFNLKLPCKIMSRNRFELLLRFLHFSDNEKNDKSNRLLKIESIVRLLNINFNKYYSPDEVVYVDESLIPFRGRIIFRQYLKNKRHRYGIKLFKFCSGPGYMHSFQVYSGKDQQMKLNAQSKSSEVVLNLCKDILGKGHTICTDNWYTSVELAEKLLENDTYLTGTLRKNRKGNLLTSVGTELQDNHLLRSRAIHSMARSLKYL